MRDDDAFCVNCGTPVQDISGANNGYDPGGYPTDKGYVQTPEQDAYGAYDGYDPNSYDPNSYDPNSYDPNSYDPNSYQGGYELVPNDVPMPAPVPVPTPMPVQPKKPKRKKLLIGIISGAVVLLAVVIAVFLIPKAPTDYYIVRFTSGGRQGCACRVLSGGYRSSDAPASIRQGRGDHPYFRRHDLHDAQL